MTEEIGMPFDLSCFSAPPGQVRVSVLCSGTERYVTFNDFPSFLQAVQGVLLRQQEHPEDQFYFYNDKGNLLTT